MSQDRIATDSAFGVSTLWPFDRRGEECADGFTDWDHPGAANTYLEGGNLGRFLALLKTLVLSAFPFTFGKLY